MSSNPFLDALQAKQNAAGAPKVTSVTLEEEDTEGDSLIERALSDIGNGLLEAPGQVVRGAQEAVNEVSDMTAAAGSWLNENVADLGSIEIGMDGVSWKQGTPSENDLTIPEAAMPAEPETVTGGLVNNISQFVAGMWMGGRYLKAAGLGKATSVAGRVAEGAAKGAIADFSAFDPHEERLSNLIEEHPALHNPVTAFLAASPDDGEAMGRFKNALEGLGLGMAVEGLSLSVGALKAARQGDAAAVEQIAEQLDTVVEKPDLPIKAEPPEQLAFDLGEPPRPDTATSEVVVNPGAKVPPLRPTVSDASFKPVKKLIEVDDKALGDLISLRSREQAYRGGEAIAGIRTDLIENGDDINSIMGALRSKYQAAFSKAEAPRSWDTVRANVDRLSDLVGDDPRIMLQRMSAQYGNLQHLDAETRMYEDFLATVGDKLYRLGELVADPKGPTGSYASRGELMDAFAQHWELMGNVQLMYKGVQSNIARALNSMKMGGRVNKELLAGADGPEDFFAGGERQLTKLARRVVATGGSLKGLTKSTRRGVLQNAVETHNEYWINAILSGPKTHVVNMLSNAITTAVLPAEKMIAGSLKVGSPEGRKLFMEGALQYASIASSLRDAVTLASRSLKMGENILDPGKATIELRRGAISADAYGITDPALKLAVDFLGNVVRVPSRLLTAEDEFFKQLNYRASVRARAWREGIQSGLKGPALADHVTKALDDAVDEVGRFRNLDAIQEARSASFTDDLKASTWMGNRTMSESLMTLSEAHPSLRLVLPFIRTPTNIMRYVWNRTPGLNLARKQYMDDILGKRGPRQQALARAQFATGSVLWGTAITSALEGRLTGAGPRDKQQRRMLESTGWRPYSVRMEREDGTVEYVSYQRLDPFGMFLGLAADYAEAGNALDGETRGEVVGAMSVALLRNIQSKSYLTGLTNIVQALSEPEQRMQRFIWNQVASYVPAAVSAFKDDPLMREVRSLTDAVSNRLPGRSETVDPVRNVLGDPIATPTALGPDFLSPFAQAFAEGDTVGEELSRLMQIHGATISPPEVIYGPVDLREFRSDVSGHSAYDRYLELHGEVKVGGRTVKERLRELIGSPMYANELTDGGQEFDGSRLLAVQKIIGAYRKVAMGALRKEIPELHEAMKEADRVKAFTLTR